MRRIVCDECKKWYDYDRDEFCPKCGAFNQPVKTWGTDAQGNVIRLDGVNEQNHAGSFVHSEVHKEKRVRQARGMDYKGNAARRPPVRPTPQRQPSRGQPSRRKADHMKLIKAIFIAIGVIMLITWILPLFFLTF
ncbi:MAG: hydrogenase maturation nickel metallochaperone HypA [Oscillibacter sp.]|nr:hydrogenase maturation nickel metallochaperone HypA [Oscillibacter sp.]